MDVEAKTVTVDVSEAFIVKTDASELCRLCANTDNQLIPIFKGEGLDHNIHSKIEKHIPIIKVTELDKLPLQICYQCASTLIAWHNLYEGCRVADKRLREILSVNEKTYQDETFEDYVDDYRDDYEEPPQPSYDNLPSNTVPSTSNLVSEDLLKTSATQITHLDISKTLNETELDSTDERCLRWTCDQMNTLAEERRANMPGIGSSTVLSATKEMCYDFLTENSKDAVDSSKETETLPAVCECVWNRFACSKCAKYDDFVCYYCPTVFLRVDERNRHLRASHRNELLANSVTYFAGKRAEIDFAVGERQATEPCQYRCDECDCIFTDKVNLIEHFRIHRQSKSQTIKSNDKQSMILTSSRPTRKRKSRYRAATAKRSRISKSASSFHCAVCSFEAHSKPQLRKHLVSVHAFNFDKSSGMKRKQVANENRMTKQLTEELAEKSFKTLDTGTEGDENEPACGYYICAVCGQIFLKRHSFTRHVNLHSSSRYDCDKCKKTFTSESVLAAHQSRKHKELPKNVFFLNGRKYLKCELCSFTCRNERNKLEEHMRVHTGEKPFTCELCGKQFRTKALLRVHRRYVHEGIKEHACDVCGRCFSNKRYMEEHRRIHTGEKPLVCDLCGKTFRQNSSLSKHVENHLGIKRHGCHLCEKRFSNSHHLNIHIKRHMGEANFVCSLCAKGFVDQYQLKNHQVVHSEERPFVCSLCGTGFKLLKHLKQHGKTHGINKG